MLMSTATVWKDTMNNEFKLLERESSRLGDIVPMVSSVASQQEAAGSSPSWGPLYVHHVLL